MTVLVRRTGAVRATRFASTAKFRALAGVSAAALICASGISEAQAQQPAASASDAPAVEEIVVTGSRIIRDGYEAPTPLTVVGTAEIQAANPQNLADFVNQLPALSGSQTPANSFKSVSSAQSGLNLLNLRSLGTTRTLVLLDGQRSVTSDVLGETDVNNFPQTLVSRIDVVTGGASATYGSDAVAGVVNFILDKTYTGVKGEISGGVTTYGDDRNWKVSLTGGTGFANGKGHFLIQGEMVNNDGIPNVPRDWARTGWHMINNPAYTATNGQPRQMVVPNAGLSNATQGGIIASGPLKGIYFGPGGVPAQLNYGSIVSDPYMSGGDWRYTNDDVYGSLDTAVYRQSVFTRASYDITDDINAFVQLSWNAARTFAYDAQQYALGNLVIKSGNPFIPASVAAQMTALKLTTINIGTMNGDLPPFGSSNKRRVNRYVVGANGKVDAFDTVWSWDTYYQKGVSHTSENVNTTYNSNFAAAINAVAGPNGTVVCAAAAANPGCVPYNILGQGVNSQAALNYIQGYPHRNQIFKQDVEALNVRGEPFSDWAGPVSLAAGLEHRRESVYGDSTAQDKAQNEFAGNFLPVIGHYMVTEGYLETVVPLAKETVWAKALDLSAAARFTGYSVSGYVTTWKVGATYSPIDDIRFRATQSRDIRAPNLNDLYTAGATAVFTVIDPLLNNSQYTIYQSNSGNPLLTPEKADTTNLGVVLQPNFFPGFNASFDYYRVNIKDAIGSASTQNEVNLCYQGVTLYCSAIIRGGPIVNGVSQITVVKSTAFNQAAQEEKGFDIELTYRTPLDVIFSGADGSVGFRFLATHFISNITNSGTPGVNPTNSAGGNAGGGPPKWRYLSVFSYVGDPVTLTLTGRAISAGKYSNSFIECTSGCPTSTANNITVNNNHIDGAFYLDTDIVYKFNVGGADSEFFFNVRNLFNRDPAIVAAGPGGTTFNAPPNNPSQYDILGRVFRTGLRFKM